MQNYAELKFYHLKREEIARHLGVQPKEIWIVVDKFGNFDRWIWALPLKKRMDSIYWRKGYKDFMAGSASIE